jgi:hypothetical protein
MSVVLLLQQGKLYNKVSDIESCWPFTSYKNIFNALLFAWHKKKSNNYSLPLRNIPTCKELLMTR